MIQKKDFFKSLSLSLSLFVKLHFLTSSTVAKFRYQQGLEKQGYLLLAREAFLIAKEDERANASEKKLEFRKEQLLEKLGDFMKIAQQRMKDITPAQESEPLIVEDNTVQ